MAILFANLWGLLVGFPLLETHGVSLQRGCLAALPAVLFALGLHLGSDRERDGHGAERGHSGRDAVRGALGLWALGSHRRWAGAGCLIVGVPVALSIAVAAQRGPVAPAPAGLGTAGLLLATGALWAYGACALSLCVPAPDPAPTRTCPLNDVQPGTDRNRWPPRTRLTAGLFALGGFCTGVLAPVVGGFPAPAASPHPAPAWSLLAAVVGGGLAVAMTALFLANALTPARKQTVRRAPIAWLLAMAGLGAVTYLVLRS